MANGSVFGNGKNGNTVCEYCSGSLSCGKLYTALEVLAADQELLNANPELAETYEAIKRFLARSEWNYPESKKACELVNSHELVNQMTNDLIKLMDQAQSNVGR